MLRLLFLLTGVLLIQAQHQEDTITKWKAKFATLEGIPKISSNGGWITVTKSYKLSEDSAFVISTSQNKKIYNILNSHLTFLNEEGVLGQIGLKAEFLNLRSGEKNKYQYVIKTFILEKHNRYALLKNNHHLLIYNTAGHLLLDISEVDNLVVTDSKEKLYFKRENANGCEIIETSGDKENIIYSTVNKIQKLELTTTGKQLIITETAIDNDKIVVMDTEISTKILLDLDIPKQAAVNFTEVQQGKAYLISTRVKSTEEKPPLVEIWYGNDPYVNEHYKMFIKRNFWIWHQKNGKLQKITVPENYEVNSLNNERYFLTYLPRMGHNYITSEPELNGAKIYDIKLNTLTDLGNLKLVKRTTKEWDKLLDYEIICSQDGARFLASRDGVKWNLYKANGQIETLIDKAGLEQPTFSYKGDNIYFESNDGLWDYNIKKKELATLDTDRRKMTKIKNITIKRDNYSMVSFLPTEKLLVEVYDKAENVISYEMLYHSKWQKIIPQTKNRIATNNLLFNPAMTSFYSLEENYNMPPTLYAYNGTGQKRLLFDGGIEDEGVKKIRQEIFDYVAVGKDLKGVLFYPVNFNPKKRYPMVVRIYDMQRYISNGYLSPNKAMPEGFQIRTLLERGYFVYLPDISVNEKGPGLSALECVNNALDAVLKISNINIDKIGLCGQSFGGYETNFIATHSNRFATYISGSGISDIIADYYSYNYSFNKPNYFLYDSTIYRMNTSISKHNEQFQKNNPILHVERVNAPILLWAGKKDTNVPFDQSMQFYMGLRRYKKDVIALFYLNGDHSFPSGTPEEKDLSNKVLDWWDYFLYNKYDILWIKNQMKKDAE